MCMVPRPAETVSVEAAIPKYSFWKPIPEE